MMSTQTPKMLDCNKPSSRQGPVSRRSARIFSYLTLALALAAGQFAPVPAMAADDSEKIRLMAEALRSRDAANFEAALQSLEALRTLDPDNARVVRLIERTRQDLQAANRPARSEPTMREVARTPAGEETRASRQVLAASMANDPAAGLLSEVMGERADRSEQARDAFAAARTLARNGEFDQARNQLDAAAALLGEPTARTASLVDDINDARRQYFLEEALELIEAGRFNAAQTAYNQYMADPGDSRSLRRMATAVERSLRDPRARNVNEFSPRLAADRQIIEDLLLRGRSQFINGDFVGARQTFEEIETRDPDNPEAKMYQLEIARRLNQLGYLDRSKTREQMLNEVSRGWQRPRVFDGRTGIIDDDTGPSPILAKLQRIRIPRVNFTNTPLTRVLESLSELSVEFDRDEPNPANRGVNIVPLFEAGQQVPNINISLRNLTLDRILQFVTQQVNFQFDVVDDAIVVQPSSDTGERANIITDFFPIGRATVIRLTGGGGGGAPSAPRGPFDPPPAAGGGGGGGDEEGSIRDFFQRAGVDFAGVPGSSLAFDGTQLIITQTPRNMDRIRTILRRYDRTRQVEIEAKFIEITQNNLDELGFDWMFNARGLPQFNPETGLPILGPDGRPSLNHRTRGTSNNRSLADTFTTDQSASTLRITRREGDPIDLPVAPPEFGTGADFAVGASNPLFSSVGIIGSTEVGVMIRALSRRSGTDLMSAPRLTVLSGKTANIVIAQELRYPERFTDIQSTATGGGGGTGSGGAAGVTITAGTPEDFVMRPVGVELEVTPTVEDNDNISLLLNPRVTEFEGFVDYGGPSVAIADGVTATIPAGFYQPIFSTRSVRTEVTIFDGATVVIGGLTREEVKIVRDKVPVLGDIPLLGRFFRSEGETSQKRNLLIFVTANLISPGGSPIRQEVQNIESNSLFQNPIIITPGGGVNRGRVVTP